MRPQRRERLRRRCVCTLASLSAALESCSDSSSAIAARGLAAPSSDPLLEPRHSDSEVGAHSSDDDTINLTAASAGCVLSAAARSVTNFRCRHPAANRGRQILSRAWVAGASPQCLRAVQPPGMDNGLHLLSTPAERSSLIQSLIVLVSWLAGWLLAGWLACWLHGCMAGHL